MQLVPAGVRAGLDPGRPAGAAGSPAAGTRGCSICPPDPKQENH